MQDSSELSCFFKHKKDLKLPAKRLQMPDAGDFQIGAAKIVDDFPHTSMVVFSWVSPHGLHGEYLQV